MEIYQSQTNIERQQQVEEAPNINYVTTDDGDVPPIKVVKFLPNPVKGNTLKKNPNSILKEATNKNYDTYLSNEAKEKIEPKYDCFGMKLKESQNWGVGKIEPEQLTVQSLCEFQLISEFRKTLRDHQNFLCGLMIQKHHDNINDLQEMMVKPKTKQSLSTGFTVEKKPDVLVVEPTIAVASSSTGFFTKKKSKT
jgi:hypothetical protein